MVGLGRPLRCTPLVKVAVGAGFIPLFIRLLAKGGYAASWACAALTHAGISGIPSEMPGLQEATNARAAFISSGGVEAAVELLALPLRHAGLAKLPSLANAADAALCLMLVVVGGVDADRAFRVRCVDAGLVAPLIQHLAREVAGSILLRVTRGELSACALIYQLCRDSESRPGPSDRPFSPENPIPCIVAAFINGGIAPVLARLLRLPEGCAVWGLLSIFFFPTSSVV